MLFVWVTLTSTRVPTSLTHRIRFNVAGRAGTGPPDSQDAVPGQGSPFTIDGIDAPLSSALPRVIGPPLEGDRWLALNGPHNNVGHRRALIALAGQARIAQRFAVDWVRLYEDGRTFRGEPLDNNSYRSFGANVLAVDDGVVRDVLDGIPENVPHPTARVLPITPQTLVGNYVLLDIGGDAYAVYAHLRLGSVQVKAGDRVRKGQVLGRVGNTGNSSEPHLHFHMVDRPSPIDAEGIPYALESSSWNRRPTKRHPPFHSAARTSCRWSTSS
ncbi:MAG: M23 family metallopeptidase [Acidobacteria bacterium]|nr:M23 family metallopeptidase [Acidobacteriota bacterium]